MWHFIEEVPTRMTGVIRHELCKLCRLHRENRPGGQVREITWVGCVVAGVLRIREIVDPCVQSEVVQVRKKSRARVEPMTGRKVIQVTASGWAWNVCLKAHVKVIELKKWADYK